MTDSSLLAGLATALAVVALAELAHAPQRRGRGRRFGTMGAPGERGGRLPRLLARAGGGRLARLGSRWRPAGDAAARLEAAGFDGAHAPQLHAVRGGAALAGLAVIAPLALGMPLRWIVLTTAAAAGIGYLAPDVWLRRRAQHRNRAIDAELADVLDLLRVAAAAGLPPRRALQEVGRRHPGVLAQELARAAARIGLGAPDDEVLETLERRCPAAGIPALTAALTRARRLGAPLSPTLAAQAEQARARRAQRCAEAAARAAPKIQLVVALLLVPSVLLLVAAALVPALLPT